jgi:methionyl-tRNA formyltransferase
MEAIYEAGGKLDLAITLHDDIAATKSGRIYLNEFCAARQISLAKVRNINDADALARIASAQLDWLFIVGWSQIARRDVLNAPRKGVLGMHPTLLPQGRGRAAIPWAILLGLPETGVTLFKLDEGVDTGPIVAQERVPIDARETATTLYRKVDEAHVSLLKKNWNAMVADKLPLIAQDNACATEWAGRKPEDGRLLPTMSVVEADRMIRAVTRPYPGAFLEEGPTRVRVWSAGAPGEELPGDGEISRAARRFTFRDGWLDSRNFSVEKS